MGRFMVIHVGANFHECAAARSDGFPILRDLSRLAETR